MDGRSPFPLFDPEASRAACGTGLVCETSGAASRRVVTLAIEALKRLFHRGAKGADLATGDGAGVLTDLPAKMMDTVLGEEIRAHPEPSERLAVAVVFIGPGEAEAVEAAFRRAAADHGMRWLGRRKVPTDPDVLGDLARASRPAIFQYFLACPDTGGRAVESRLYRLRRVLERGWPGGAQGYVASLSSKTLVYKGLMTSQQIDRFYPDLARPDFEARVAVFHERFATNTVPSWRMAQPFRLLAHNGEINTIKGNRLWMRAREGTTTSPFWGEDIEALLPILGEGESDSASLDGALEFLVRSGRDPFSALMMLVPDPYAEDRTLPAELRDFYVYHENLIEPWDGPAALVFTDGDVAGAKLDRNGLRPLRYTRTRDGLLVVASEAGVVDVPDADLLENHHMRSGEILAVALDGSGVRGDAEVKRQAASSAPFSLLLERNFEVIRRGDAAEEFGAFALPEGGFDRRLRLALGWTRDEVESILAPMAETGREPVGSMGDDTPPAVLSDRPRRLYDRFKQAFAQVTNPPIDPIRERFVTGLFKYLGSEDNLLAERPEFHGAIRIEGPVLSPREVGRLEAAHDGFPHARIRCHASLREDLADRIEEISKHAANAAARGVRIVFLTDEGLGPDVLPVPMLLAVAAVHHHLVRHRIRSRISLVAVTGDVVEDHHVACLAAVGASAVYPYMAYELLRERYAAREDWPNVLASYRWALEKGLLKIMSKMGISTFSSYHGSMNVHALGLSEELLRAYFPSLDGHLGGEGLDRVRDGLLAWHRRAFAEGDAELPEAGTFRYRKGGELHGFAPARFRKIHALSGGASAPTAGIEPPVHVRDLLEIRAGEPSADDVEPAERILRRFGSGAISFGAISDEAHRTLARGLWLVGGRSSSGEGGEPADRFAPGNPDPSANCTVKQVASARFGVTTDYLTAARELQIKMAQGAKPGEGGQLPGHKVTLQIAEARGATPGVALISPPPHHDIYSIEDLAQLIFDLRAVNPRASISVKLVAQPGIGQVACGVAKAGADAILVSGGDGGTGASPLGSLKHTGFPWELGLAEVHQALTAAGLRRRVRLRVDGGLQSGRDVAIAALVGAEEFDFGTAVLVALGCVMARQCHLNTCPAGIATQDPALRRKFRGKPEHVAAYLQAVAEETREALGRAGFRSLQDAVGRTDRLAVAAHRRDLVAERGIELAAVLNPGAPGGLPLADLEPPPVRPGPTFDDGVIDEVRAAIVTHGQAVVRRTVRNTDRAVGTRLAGELAFLYGRGGFRGNVQLRLRGAAGQSFGAFLCEGVELRLRGVANDYVAKGMSGGLVSIRMPREVRESGVPQTVIGNVALYGATGGTLLVAGRAGERFAVRNSGASAVVEGIGNHGCEYMTRGTVVVLGEAGRNFGAGMTGGVAYLELAGPPVEDLLNPDFVRVAPMDEGDHGLLQRMLRRHLFHTGSTAARAILERWDASRVPFVKVVPTALDAVDFRAIHDRQKAARRAVMLSE